MTGTTVMIIHSGLLPDWTKASISFSRLASFFGFSSDFDSAISCRSRTISVSRLSAISISRTASAPIMAVKLSAPYWSCASRNSSSVRSCFSCSGVMPGSTTM